MQVDVMPGCRWFPGYLDRAQQVQLRDVLRSLVVDAPFFAPEMPRTGKPFSVRMTNLGSLGWVSDRLGGYRYQPTHPATGEPWPAIPPEILDIWRSVTGAQRLPEACLVNFYAADAKMGLHQDRDEADLAAPVVSVSLGDTARFRIGGSSRSDPTRGLDLKSGDVLVFGGPARLAFHGIDRVLPGTSTLLADGGRINLTLRCVTPAS
jgi:alkylated DNA repair protein (DNA oxidative demethylase)